MAIQGVVSHPLLLLFKRDLSQGRASVKATSIGLWLKREKFYNYGVVKNWGCVNHLADRLPTCGLRWRGMVGECGGVEEGGCVLMGGGEGWCLSSNNCLMRTCSSCSLTCGTQQGQGTPYLWVACSVNQPISCFQTAIALEVGDTRQR